MPKEVDPGLDVQKNACLRYFRHLWRFARAIAPLV